MLQIRPHHEHTIDTLFILALFVVFAATSFLVVYIGASQYQSIVSRMDENNQIRGCTSYLSQKLHQNDTSDAIEIQTIDHHTVLSLTNAVNGSEYTTYIYTYENSLREFYGAAGVSFSLSEGQIVLEASDFTAEFVSASRLKLTVTDLQGQTETFYLSLQADSLPASD